MARFALSRDIEFFKSISRELVDDVVGTPLVFFKLALDSMRTNIYGETLSKVYKNGVEVRGLIQRDPTSTNYDEFGPDTQQSVEFRMNRFDLKDRGLYPEIGDVIFHNQSYFEVFNVRDDQYVGGRTGELDPNERFSIICQTVMVRRTQLNIESPQL
jgi:hypothetical protein